MNFTQFEEVIGRLLCIKELLYLQYTDGIIPELEASDISDILNILTSAYPEFADEYHKDCIRMLNPPLFKP